MKNEKPTIWAFGKVDNLEDRPLIYESVRNGKSRFGWSSSDTNNLLKEENHQIKGNRRQLRLLEVKPGDWIVHRNTPEDRQFVAARVTSEYQFDEGLECSNERTDFRHCFEVDKETVVTFNRDDPRILPTVWLDQRPRLQRISAVDDFIQSIDNLKRDPFELDEGDSREEYHLRAKMDKELLPVATESIHDTHKGKKLEGFLAKVFREIPGVEDVNEHGQRWGTDHGADLIVTMRDPLGLARTIIVQVKSYEGEHYDLSAVEQVKTGIKEFEGDAGMIITTAKRTEKLENEIERISGDIDRPITLLAGSEVSAFVIKHASKLLFNLYPR